MSIRNTRSRKVRPLIRACYCGRFFAGVWLGPIRLCRISSGVRQTVHELLRERHAVSPDQVLYEKCGTTEVDLYGKELAFVASPTS